MRMDVADVKKRSPGEPDVNECGLHSRKNLYDSSLVNVADNPPLSLALYVYLSYLTVLDKS